jgi:transposase
MQTQKNKLDFTNQNVYVGFDVHKKNWKVSILMDSVFHKTFSQDPKPELLYAYLKRNFPGGNYFTAYEAGFCGFWIHNALTSYGVNSMVVNPADIPTTGKEIIQKEDARDSLKIAKALRSKTLTSIYIPKVSTCDDRALVRTRITLTKDLARNKNRVKAYLHYQGIEIPQIHKYGSKTWTKNFMNWLTTVQLQTDSGIENLNIYVEECKNLKSAKLKVTRKIREISRTESYSKNASLLQTIPGIGLITAMEILTEIEDIKRFKNFDHFVSYIGIIPSTNSSGEKDRVGEMTYRGHQVLRSAIIESAWIALRIDTALTKKYIELTSRMNAQKAVVRIAKKLLSRIFYVLKNEKPYEYHEVENFKTIKADKNM